LTVGITSCQSSVSTVFVRVTKLLAIKHAFYKRKLNNLLAKREGEHSLHPEINALPGIKVYLPQTSLFPGWASFPYKY
jgi:hypothetical protein